MKYRTNANYEYIIGKVGFDKIEIIKDNPEADMIIKSAEKVKVSTGEKIVQYEITEAYGVDVETLKKVEGITCSNNRRFKIDGGSYVFVFGISSMRPFSYLQLRVDEKGNNIINMNMNALKKRIEDTEAELKENYGINIGYDFEKLRIKKAEINQTFPVLSDYDSYDRVLTLLSFSLFAGKRRKKGDESTATFSKWEDKKKKSETDYLITGKTLGVKAYNKAAEVESMHFDTDLMRLEIIAEEQNLTSLSSAERNRDDHTVYLKDVTDNSIQLFFTNYFKKAFEYSDKYLKSELKFPPHAEGDGARNFEEIINTSLRHVLRLEPESFCESVVEIFAVKEAKHKLPHLLDINDLTQAITQTGITNENLIQLERKFEDMYEHPERYSNLVKKFIGQRSLYEELRTKLCNPEDYQLVGFHSTNNEMEQDIYWLGNPKYLQPNEGITNEPFMFAGTYTCVIRSENRPKMYRGVPYELQQYEYVFNGDEYNKQIDHEIIEEEKEEREEIDNWDGAMEKETDEFLKFEYDNICREIKEKNPSAEIMIDLDEYIKTKRKDK